MTEWIRTPAELEEVAASLAGSRAVALDTESDSLHHYKEKVCLVQLAADTGRACLVDPLAIGGLTPLGRIIGDPATVKVLHGADYDVVTLKRDFGFTFANLFDTMIAARFLGMAEVGLQALARNELGVALSKESQKDDWSRRPLTPLQEAYALADVQHLLVLHDRLEARLAALGRLPWVREECEAVAALPPGRRGRDPEAWTRIKGVRRLARRNQALLRSLHEWREDLAERTDIPPFKLIGSETLLALSERRPKTLGELREVRGLSARILERGEEILRVMEAAWALPTEALPLLASTPRPLVSDATRRRIDALKAWRTAEATRLKVDVSVVLPQRLLEKVAESGPADVAGLEAVEGLRRWRVAAFGPALLDIVRRA